MSTIRFRLRFDVGRLDLDKRGRRVGVAGIQYVDV